MSDQPGSRETRPDKTTPTRPDATHQLVLCEGGHCAVLASVRRMSLILPDEGRAAMIRTAVLFAVTLFAIGFAAPTTHEARADGTDDYRPARPVVVDRYVAARPRPVVYPEPTYVRPMPVRMSGPVCDSCGGWTRNGCYMSMRKIINDMGKAELRCVEACDADTRTEKKPIEASLTTRARAA